MRYSFKLFPEGELPTNQHGEELSLGSPGSWVYSELSRTAHCGDGTLEDGEVRDLLNMLITDPVWASTARNPEGRCTYYFFKKRLLPGWVEAGLVAKTRGRRKA